MPKDQLITTVEEIIENIDTLYSFGKRKQRDFHDKRIKLGRWFVAVRQGNKYQFAPSKFVGYVKNDERQSERRDYRDGRETNKRIGSVLGPQVEIGSAEHTSIEKAYLTYCEDHEIKPSNYKRNYWLIKAEDYKITADLLECKTNTAYKKWTKKRTLTVPVGALKPHIVRMTSTQYTRDPEIRAYILVQSKGICEACDCEAPFKKPGDIPFLEVHHVKHLAKGGSDEVSNAVALCPNCHRKLHYSVDKKKLKRALLKKVERLKKQ